MRFKNILLAIGIAVLMLPVYAQTLDSLKAAALNAPTSEKARMLLDLAYEYGIKEDYETCIQYADQGYRHALSIGDTLQILRGGRLLSQAYRKFNMLEESFDILNRIINVAERHKDIAPFRNEYKYISGSMALTQTWLANYDEALKYNFLCLAHLRKYDKRSNVGLCLNNIGLVYYKLKDYAKAQKYFFESTRIKKETNDTNQLSTSLTNEALSHAYLGNYTEAQELIQEVFDLCGDECPEFDLMQCHFTLGVVFFGLKDRKESEYHFLQSIASAERRRDVRYQLDNIAYLCQIYLAGGNHSRAAFYLRTAERLMDHDNSFNLELLKVYVRFFQFYTKTGDFRKASSYQQKYIDLKDSVYNEELTTNLMKIEADYLERENKARLAAQDEVLALNTEVIRNQKLTNIISIALALVVIAFAAVLLRQYVRKKRDNTRLDQRVRERTHELEINREVLLKALEERDLILGQINAEVRDALSRFRGLMSLSVTEVVDPVARQYLDEVGKTAEDLSFNVGNYFLRQKTNALA